MVGSHARAVQGSPLRQEAEVRKRYVVVLSEQERARLHTMIGRGVAPASALTHARILLKANQGEAGPGWTDAAIGAALEVNPATVARIRQRYVVAGLDAAIYRQPPTRQYRRRLDGEQEARLVALTCSAPPRATSAGRCGCWPTGWWSCRWSSRCRMRRSAR